MMSSKYKHNLLGDLSWASLTLLMIRKILLLVLLYLPVSSYRSLSHTALLRSFHFPLLQPLYPPVLSHILRLVEQGLHKLFFHHFCIGLCLWLHQSILTHCIYCIQPGPNSADYILSMRNAVCVYIWINAKMNSIWKTIVLYFIKIWKRCIKDVVCTFIACCSFV